MEAVETDIGAMNQMGALMSQNNARSHQSHQSNTFHQRAQSQIQASVPSNMLQQSPFPLGVEQLQAGIINVGVKGQRKQLLNKKHKEQLTNPQLREMLNSIADHSKSDASEHHGHQLDGSRIIVHGMPK